MLSLTDVSRRNLLRLGGALLIGGALVACSSSKNSVTTTVEPDATAQDASQEREGIDPGTVALPSGAYAHGWVIAPDSSGVAGALVETEPYVEVTPTDSTGYFVMSNPFPENEYWFVGRKPGNRDLEGRTRVRIPGEQIAEPILVVLGREVPLDAVDIDSVRASPVGPGRKRTGN